MISFLLNGIITEYNGDPQISLLDYLREQQGLTSVKDGCSGQAACGACLVEIDGRARLSCVTKTGTLEGANIITPEGVPSPPPIKQRNK